jgi:hypothetical protein
MPSLPHHMLYFRLSSEERRSIAELFADAGRTMPFEQKPNVLWEDFADLLVVASPQVIKLKDRTGGLRVEERILKVLLTRTTSVPKQQPILFPHPFDTVEMLPCSL